ncbi:FAD-dependent oxidoreductase [Microbacterium resistens]|uniref:FAD-dependent oxidoreductase n=1 Tax=Microbacterium resistens TaxID=156977 RepID=UPI00082FB822|nr:NAD(P)/FAD-dependent oxidoreductase [Microbacterium resistens]
MFITASLDDQLHAQRDDPLRILIVGAGVAGTALAQLLRRRGLHPALVERTAPGEHPGYMLALMPNADPVFRDLGSTALYRERSVALRTFAFHSHRGRVLRRDPLGDLLSAHGDYRGIDRGTLLDVLTADGCTVTPGLTVASCTPERGGRRVTLASAPAEGADAPRSAVRAERFDLVVGADGIGSALRALLPVQPIERTRTGWGGWVLWSEDDEDPHTGDELWGNGFFLGAYPVGGGTGSRRGVFLGGPAEIREKGAAVFAQRVRHGVPAPTPRLAAALDAAAADPSPYWWRLEDARAAAWTAPGAILLGDAAAAFLPTAGIGAAMALESAWTLSRVLPHADRRTLPAVLAAWEQEQRPRVESAQSNSRLLARVMFRQGRLLTTVRETALRLASARAALGPIVRLMSARPEPAAMLTRAGIALPAGGPGAV